VLEDGRWRLKVEVAPSPTESWLVLGQSENEGWEAVVSGGQSLGAPRLVDGFASGWRLGPSSETRVVELTWRPQRVAQAGLALSGLGALACLALVVVSFVRKRLVPIEAPWSVPTLVGPFAWSTAPPRWRSVAGVVAAVLVVMSLVAGPAVGLVATALAAASVLLRRGRSVSAAVAVGAVVVTGVYTAVSQARNDYGPGFAWARSFSDVHAVAWVAVAALAVDVAVGWVRRRRAPRARP
jgi:hypothetical protein